MLLIKTNPLKSIRFIFFMLKKLLFSFLILSLTLFPKIVLADQNVTISGYLTDKTSGEYLIGANILVRDTNRGASTNTSGYYVISNLSAGSYIIRFSYLGYQDKLIEVDLGSGEDLRLDVELSPGSLDIEEVTIISERDREDRKTIGISQISTQRIKEVPSVLQADVFRSVQLLPGVKAASDFSSGLYIRGGSPDQTLILLDRTTVYNPSHFFGFFSTFNPDAIKDVRLYKGGYPAEYGGRLGSVIDIYNKDGNRRNFQGSASVGLLSSRAIVEGPFSKGSYMIAARRSTLEPLFAALRETVEPLPDSFYFYDVNAKLNFDINENNRFSISSYLGKDDVVFPFGDDLEFELDYGNRTISGTWTHLLNNRLFANFTGTWSQYYNFPDFSFGGTNFRRENFVYDLSLKTDLEWIPNERHNLSTGIWAGNITLLLNDFFDGTQIFDSRIQSQYASWYVQDVWRPSVRWRINAGLRANYFSAGDYLKLEPRFSVDYNILSDVRLQLAYGRYYQFLTLITNEAFSGFDVWLTTDEGVPPAWGDQFVAGIKTPFMDYFDVEFEIYYRTMNDLFELDPFLPDAAGLDYADVFRFGEGYAYGIEVLLDRTVGRVNGFIGYTFGVTRRKFEDFNNSKFYPPKYDRTHDVNIVANYNFSTKWRATAVFNYATGQAFTQPLGRTGLNNNPFGSNDVNALIVGNVNASRLPAYHRMDVGVSRFGRFFNIGDSELQLQIINVYSRRNIWFYTYDFDENPIRQEEVALLPILPSVSYTVNF